ncbi:MAG: HDOD domain-containing protein [Proteobacteria bacterium]|nr:HDOD domain-containing protein [Pseudomonadota bacterium]
MKDESPLMEIHQKITDLIRSKRTQLPTLPVIVTNILKVAGDESASAKDLVDIISKDKAISNKILRLANSAYYGFSKNVDSIFQATVIIGFDEIIGLTIGMSVFSTLHEKGPHSILDMQDLWMHAIGCGSVAKKIVKKTVPGAAEQIFMAGLLHDIGKVIFTIYFPEEYRTVLEDAKESQTPLHHKEKETFGLDHAMLAGLLMESWKFPDDLLLPSSFHHNSAACPPNYQHHAMIIELANSLCQRAGIGYSGNPVIARTENISHKLGLTDQDVKTIVKELKEQRSEIEEFFELIT